MDSAGSNRWLHDGYDYANSRLQQIETDAALYGETHTDDETLEELERLLEKTGRRNPYVYQASGDPWKPLRGVL